MSYEMQHTAVATCKRNKYHTVPQNLESIHVTYVKI